MNLGMRQSGTWDPLLQCFSVCTWINLSSSNKIQINYNGLKITAIRANFGQDTETKTPNFLFWRAGSKEQVLCMPPAYNITEGLGKPPKPPLQPAPWTHPLPSYQIGTDLGREQARETVACFSSLCYKDPNSFAWNSYLVSDQFLLMRKAKSPGMNIQTIADSFSM